MSTAYPRNVAAELTDDEIIKQVTESLRAKFPDTSDTEIDAIVREEFLKISDRPVRDFFGVLTERAAKKRLKKG
ncbi:MAG: hypothetical protein DI534_03150 [Leifsonia xyli]|nr:MAG: hypothetical protein DI534_03150 [Leifsonia xyli]